MVVYGLWRARFLRFLALVAAIFSWILFFYFNHCYLSNFMDYSKAESCWVAAFICFFAGLYFTAMAFLKN